MEKAFLPLYGMTQTCRGISIKANLFLFDMEKNRVSDQLTFENKVGLHQWLDDEHLMITALREQADKDLSEKGIPLTVFFTVFIYTPSNMKNFFESIKTSVNLPALTTINIFCWQTTVC